MESGVNIVIEMIEAEKLEDNNSIEWNKIK